MTILRNSILNRILLSMTKIPPDILEGLYKLRIRTSEKLKTVLDLYDLDIHQKKEGLDYHRLKTMVKRSIEQEILRRTPWSRIMDKTACTKNSWTSLAMGIQRAVCEGDNCSFRHDMNKRGKVAPSCPSPNFFIAVECLDDLARITSMELAITLFMKNDTFQNAFSTRPRVVVGLGA